VGPRAGLDTEARGKIIFASDGDRTLMILTIIKHLHICLYICNLAYFVTIQGRPMEVCWVLNLSTTQVSNTLEPCDCLLCSAKQCHVADTMAMAQSAPATVNVLPMKQMNIRT
jgi:hypothetical protein